MIANGNEYFYEAVCRRVIDGDTIELDIDLGFKIKHRIMGRMADYNAAEIRGGTDESKALGRLHTDHLTMLVFGQNLLVKTEKTGKFGRWIIYVWVDGRSVNEIMKWFVEGKK